MADIAQRGNRLTKKINYDKAYVKSRSLVKDVYDAVAPKHSLGIKKKPHSSKEGVTASLGRTVRDVRAGGGRAGHALGHTAGRRLTKTLERLGGGPEGKPHSTQAGRISAGVRKIKRGAKSWNKKINKMAKDAHLGRPFMKIKKEKDWADPSETVGGRRIQTKGGPELIPPKRKDDVGVGGYQEPLKNRTERPLGVGGRKEFKKGGSDKKWIQKAVNPKHKGYCTPMTKKTCTPARKALARTFKKKAKTGW